MVAAWIKAETGVGPAMASGSHTNKGIWADFPAAPTKSNRQIAKTNPGDSAKTAAACSEISAKRRLPKLQ